tara:strand:- start:470 stop:1462 length:993 start_codon:yes stop_codon:yes gene_type:complete
MKNLISLTLAFFVFGSNFVLGVNETKTYKIAFGSCIEQNYFVKAWNPIKNEQIDAFFFLGDNVYGDTPDGKLDNMAISYNTLEKNLPNWLSKKEIFAIWDDHDYGVNDGGGDYPLKEDAQVLFNDFWKIPVNDSRRIRPGIYFKKTLKKADKEILIVGLDTRYFRSNLIKGDNGAYLPNNNPKATILGTDQWQWLEKTLKGNFDMLILATSIQLLATQHRFEKWSNFPYERQRLLGLLHDLESKVVVVSGDRHRAGIYRKENIIELTASSMNLSKFKQYETDPLLYGETYPENNYGVVEIAPKEIIISIKSETGAVLESIKIDTTKDVIN